MTQPGFFSPRERGFTLIEIAIVIAIMGLLLTMMIGISASLIGQQRREATRQRLASIETALALFASQNRRLPCPALGTIPSGGTNAGVEGITAGACDGNQQFGIVPWVAIGLSEQDATDGWGNRMTYRVAPQLIATNAMDFSYCDPAGALTAAAGTAPFCPATCNAAVNCVPPVYATQGKGLRIRTVGGAVVMEPTPVPVFPAGPASTGAAYVVISHGENAEGALNNTGTIQAANGPASGDEEKKNNANVAYASGNYFVDDFQQYAAGSTHFDDFVIRPSILAVATKAQLGPRTRF